MRRQQQQQQLRKQCLQSRHHSGLLLLLLALVLVLVLVTRPLGIIMAGGNRIGSRQYQSLHCHLQSCPVAASVCLPRATLPHQQLQTASSFKTMATVPVITATVTAVVIAVAIAAAHAALPLLLRAKGACSSSAWPGAVAPKYHSRCSHRYGKKTRCVCAVRAYMCIHTYIYICMHACMHA